MASASVRLVREMASACSATRSFSMSIADLHYDRETLEFAWGFPTPSRFPGQSLAVIGTFWLGVVWELENPRRIPGIVPIAINPYLPVARFVRLDLFQWNSSDGG